MANIDANGNPIPPTGGTVIATEWGTPVAERIVARYTDATERDSIETLPQEGRIIWVEDVEQIQVYDGSSWVVVASPWQDYTPAYTGLSISSGTVTSRYWRIGDTVTVMWRFTFGSGSAVGAATVGLPFSPAGGSIPLGVAKYTNTGIAGYIGQAFWEGTTMSLRVSVTSGTYGVLTALSSSVPFTWATGDTISFSVTYEAA